MTLIIAIALLAATPDTLSIRQCYHDAVDHYPLGGQLALQESIAKLRVDNLSTRFLPEFSIGGQAVYHSEVARLSLPTGTSISQPSKDQYKVALAVDQLVYDGGLTKQLKAIERIQGDLAQGKIHVELYRLREQVNTAFLGALMFAAQSKVLETLRADLDSKRTQVQALVDNGVALRSDVDVLAAELINVDQQQIEARANRRAALDVLGELIGQTLSDDIVLTLPEIELPRSSSASARRPEYGVFDLTIASLEYQAQLSGKKNLPKVSVFAESAVGRPPGLNFFETDVKPFYTVGLRMRWKAWDWRFENRERQMIEHRQALVEAEERAFTKQLAIAVQSDLTDIDKLSDLIRRDEDLLALRRRVAEEAASRLRNGVITATDYVQERNAETRATLSREIHRIQLAHAKVRYATKMGWQ